MRLNNLISDSVVPYLRDLLQNIRIADLFDIAIISLLTYAVLVWFKRTASRFVFIGILILGIIYAVARFFHMYLTEYVLQGFFAILLIVMVVIFQEDLRRFFERLAIWGVGRKARHSPSSAEYNIDVLTLAVTSLAQKRFGALIVLRGEDYLDRHIEGGNFLEGRLSESLLESIFDPHSMGHDGAVIIENGRVVKFGCHLPLSLNTAKVGLMGLRHTAALGLSELCDALCIVVSEEKGFITVAHEGNLQRLTSTDQLTATLENFYRTRSSERKNKNWWNWLLDNSWEKAVALILASVLWLIFGYQTEIIRRDFIMPIAYRNLPADWIIDDQKTKEATITFVGSKQAFDLLNPQVLKVIVDMSNIHEGKQEVPLSQTDVYHPSNLSVVGINPEKINFVAHKLIPMELPVKVQTTGKLASDLLLQTIETVPKSIKVMVIDKGKRPQHLLTEPIHLDSLSETTTTNVKLVLPSNIQMISSNPSDVQVTFKIMVPAELPVKVDTIGVPPQGIEFEDIVIKPSEVNVLLPGNKPDTAAIAVEAIDLTNITSTVTLTRKLLLPSGVQLADNQKPEVRITVNVKTLLVKP